MDKAFLRVNSADILFNSYMCLAQNTELLPLWPLEFGKKDTVSVMID